MRAFLAAVSLLAAGTVPAAGLELTPAWSGWSGSTGATELEIRVPAADASGELRLAITSGPHTVLAHAIAQRGVPTSIRVAVPVTAELSRELRVQVTGPGAIRHDGSVTLQVAERPLLAWVSAAAGAAAGTGGDAPFSLLRLDAAGLPRTAAAYSTLAGVAIDAGALAALDDAQMAALLGHARACGFLVVSGAPDAALATFRRVAGCGGRMLLPAPASLDLAGFVTAFLDRPSLRPLPAAKFAAIAPADPRLAWLTAALVLYFVAGGAAIVVLRRARTLALVPAAATLLLGGVLALLGARERLAVWAEADAGDLSAVYAAQLDVAGLAPAAHGLDVPQLLGDPDPCTAADAMRLEWSPGEQRFVRAEVATRLLGRRSLCFDGSFPLARGARLDAAPGGTLTITNTGPAPWPLAWLVWEGRVHELRDVAANARIRLDATTGREPRNGAERLAVERAGWARAGLLMPLDLAALDLHGREGAAWLLVRIAPQAGAAT